ncbi:TIR domain-containing protein [Acinetobacter sp. YH01022]|uniref:TIR domain-containing protein n=1 Tax=Acinetobacter sp. YH01022 TaxID=2601036 RepID=UPI0015D0E8CA|nr:TIR domain-containing protein [Acinetobacter sp. YH01022]
MTLKDRFKDKDTLIQALMNQKLVQNNKDIAEEIANNGELIEFKPDESIVIQDDFDQDVYFIIAGETELIINGSKLPYTRPAGISIGEMSAIDPTQTRSATVVSINSTVAVKLKPQAFKAIVDKYPKITKLIAIDLAQRLVQRNVLIEKCNQTPKLFIISTVESLHIAREIKAGFNHDDIEVIIWSDTGVFKGGDYTLEALERAVQDSDFGLAILQDDDVTISRETELRSPRDNVIFELGLFMGLLSRKRTFLALPRGVEQKIATDLRGLTALDYKVISKTQCDISYLVHELRKIIASLGIREKIDRK